MAYIRLLTALAPKLADKLITPRQVISTSWEDRDFILKKDVNLFCWQRQLDLEAIEYLERRLAEGPKKIRMRLTGKELPDLISGARKSWGKEYSNGEYLFWQDVSLLAYHFLQFSDTGEATLHLHAVENDACTKFHIDGYRLRLFTTYLGPGTEWLPEEAVNRSGLGKTNELIVKNPDLIQRMNAMDVGILKGEVPNKPRYVRGIVHRSPHISTTNGKRIIMRIDI